MLLHNFKLFSTAFYFSLRSLMMLFFCFHLLMLTAHNRIKKSTLFVILLIVIINYRHVYAKSCSWIVCIFFHLTIENISNYCCEQIVNGKYSFEEFKKVTNQGDDEKRFHKKFLEICPQRGK